MVVVYIIIFVVALSLLIIIHEAGHFAMAKAFKVYCFDFSVGFGPALFHRKRKNGETYFSFRAVPLGGYVSMLGEDEDEDKKREDDKKKKEEEQAKAELLEPIENETQETGETKKKEKKKRKRIFVQEDEDVDVPMTRSLAHKNRGVQAIIMSAGIGMNMILALVLFFSYETFFSHKMLNLNEIVVADDSIAASAGLTSDDLIYYVGATSLGSTVFYVFDEEATLYYEDGQEQSIVMGVNLPGSVELEKLSYDYYLAGFIVTQDEDEYGNPLYETIIVYDEEGNEIDSYERPVYLYQDILYLENTASVKFTLQGIIVDEDGYVEFNGNSYVINLAILHDEENELSSFEPLGLTLGTMDYKNDFKTAFKNTFTDFADSSHAVVDAIIGLFRGQGWSQLTGVVGIYTQTTSILQSYGWGYFLYTWGLISVNLALLNLVPIPGLDGWHLLVLLIEGISRHKVPRKFQTVMSWIGYIIIIGLFVGILVMDIWRLVV
ncbi:MAG: site-2 protease family protein [Coprobacillus sp.]|nr:site-2 protease family protein [Coprobacillus sp.]